MRLSLRTKTIAGMAIIATILLTFLLATVFSLLNQLVDESVEKSANTTANLFVSTTKNAFLSLDLASLEADTFEVLTNPSIAYVRIKNSAGKVYVEKGDLDALQKPFNADKNVRSAEDGVYEISAPIQVNDTLYGHVELGMNVNEINNAITRVRSWTYALAAFELTLVALFSFFLGSYLMAQLRQLRAGARHLAVAVKDKNYQNITVQVRGKDELSELAEAFNQLVNLLKDEHTQRQQVEDELKNFNSSLEQKVKDRTQLLNQKNLQLENANKDLKDAQVQLLQAEKMASVGQLAAGVAHEINNPIGFVSSNLATLSSYISTYQMIFAQIASVLNQENEQKRKAALEELDKLLAKQDMDFINGDINELMSDSKEGMLRVAEIVKGLKLFSRIDSEEKQLYNINDCVRTTLTMVNNQLKYICTVETHLGNVPMIPLNVGKISQVVTNLLINAGQAIESSDENGTITVTSSVNNNTVELKIEDTGCGIPASHLDKLFNPFFTTKPEGQGTGLGLSISFGIAKEHGGSLDASSVEGKGSCFILRLPIDPENNEEALSNA